MKQLIFVIFLLAGVHFIGAAQDAKTKVDGSDYKRKVEGKGTHHTAMYAQGTRKSYATHHYYHRHHSTHRHVAYRRHSYHSHVAYKRHHYSKPVAHYKKVKSEGKKGDYKAKT